MRSLTTALLSLVVSTTAHGASDWMQFDFDAQHSGINPAETFITKKNLFELHPLYHVALPSVADGAPAFLAGAATTGGRKDLVFVTTKDGRLLALDARNGATVWSQQPAAGPKYTTSSPAVDPNRQYVYSYGLDGRVHKYQVADGSEVLIGGWPQLATLKPAVEKVSSAILPLWGSDQSIPSGGSCPGGYTAR